MQGQLFEVESNWTPPSQLPRLHGPIGVDVETRDSTLGSRGPGWAFKQYGSIGTGSQETIGYITGLCISTPDDQWYFPVRHEGGGNLDIDLIVRWFKDQIQNVSSMSFFNLMYDAGWLMCDPDWNIDVFESGKTLHDAMYMVALQDELRYEYSLDSCLRDYLGTRKDESLLRKVAASYKIDPKSDMWKLHSKYVGPYGEGDGRGTLDLAQKMWKTMSGRGYDLKPAYRMEMELLPILIEMRLRGVPVDLDRADEVRRKLQALENEHLKEIHRTTGFRVRHGVPTADAVQVFEHEGISCPTTKKGNPSVTADFLERAALKNDIAMHVLKARQFNKAWRDFVDSALVDKQVNGRIHGNFHPMKSDEGGTVSGRFSSSDPNLQQVPKRNPEVGTLIRSIYCAENGCQFASLDYSSQEPRWTLHFAALLDLPGARKAVEVFQENPRTNYHRMVQELAGIDDYRVAKDINLGLVYGMGPPKLCHELGLPTEWIDTPDGRRIEVAGPEGRDLLDHYHRAVPYVKRLIDIVTNRGRRRGFVKTFIGRKCHVEGFERKGLNRIIQGSSADQIKKAILALKQEMGIIPGLLVHDETDVPWCEGPSHAKEMARVMEECVPECLVPAVVDVDIGPNWGEAKTLENA